MELVHSMAMDGEQGPYLVVCGDNSLAYHLVAELVTQIIDQVTVIMPSRECNYGPRIASIPGVYVIEAPVLSEDVFRKAGVEQASAVALVGQDDVGNVQAAFRVRALNSHLRLVIRFFNMNIVERIRALFPDCVVLSDADTAARSFVAGALSELAPSYVPLPDRTRPDRTLYVARRRDVAANCQIWELADISVPGQPELLPGDRTKADLVLVLGDAAAHRRDHSLLRALWRRIVASLSRKLVLAIFGLVVLLVVGTALFATFGHISWSEALYLTVLDAAGAAQPEPQLSTASKIFQTIVTLVGISIIPLVTGTVVGEVVRSRYPALARPRPIARHVVLVGLGDVGTRVLAQLHELDVPVLCVDSDDNARGVLLARRIGAPIVFGDVSREDTLRGAYLDTCRALIAVTNNDVTNLAAALHGREISKNKNLRVVLRLCDDDIAKQAQRNLCNTITRSVPSLAAPAFAAAMLCREILGTIPVERSVLLIAEVPIQAGSALDGVASHDVDAPHEARVIAIRRPAEGALQLPAPSDHLLTSGDRLIIVATRAGLGRVLIRSGATGLGRQLGGATTSPPTTGR